MVKAERYAGSYELAPNRLFP